MTLNLCIPPVLRDNTASWTADSQTYVYLAATNGRASIITETSRTLQEYVNPFQVFIEYELGIAASGNGVWRVDNKDEIISAILIASEQYGGTFRIDITEERGICFVQNPEDSAVEPFEYLELTPIHSLDLPSSPLRYQDDRVDRCSFDRERFAQCLLKATSGRLLVELPEPLNRYLFSRVVAAISKNAANPLQSYVGDKFTTKDEKMAVKTAPTAPAVPPAAPVAPTAPIPPPPPPAPAKLAAAPSPQATAVAARKARVVTTVPPVPVQIDMPETEPETPPAEPENPAASAEPSEPVQKPVVEDPASGADPAADPAQPVPEPAQDAPAEEPAQKERRTRRSSEVLDAEAADRLKGRHWIVIPPVDNLGERLTNDRANTIKFISEQTMTIYNALHSLQCAMFYELDLLCKEPDKPAIPTEILQKIQDLQNSLAAVSK